MASGGTGMFMFSRTQLWITVALAALTELAIIVVRAAR